jgi:hypothetical protein
MDMDEDLNSDARRVIDLARKARTPSEVDKRRVRRAVAIGLGATAAGVTSGATVASASKGLGALLGLRGIAAVVLVSSIGTGTTWWVRESLRHRPSVSSVAVPAASTAPVPVIIPVPAPQDPLLAELNLLRRAQHALREGQPGQALELAERHAILYPSSQMALERGALQVFAFCAMGRKADARSLATELLRQAPRSPLRTSLEESCAMR